MNSRYLVMIVLGLILGTVGAFWLSLDSEEQRPEDVPRPVEPYSTTVTGTYLCLPHTDTSGPQTLECALGLQTDDGVYYALDFNAYSKTPPDVPTGSRVTATGTVTPIENLSTDHWQKYPIQGIFSVTGSFEGI